MSVEPTPPALHGRRVLVVDDAPMNRKMLGLMLAPTGVHLELAENGGQALAKLQADAYDLVIMDVQMPGMDGLETTRRLRRLPDARRAATPVLGVSANLSARVWEASVQAGMNFMLCKPFTPAALYQALAALLAGADAPAAAAFAGAPAASVAPLLDETRLGVLRAELGEELCAGFLRDFKTAGQDCLEEARRAGQSGDLPALARRAHRLLGLAGMLGCAALARLAEELEAAALAGDGPEARTKLAALPGTFVATAQALQAYSAKSWA